MLTGRLFHMVAAALTKHLCHTSHHVFVTPLSLNDKQQVFFIYTDWDLVVLIGLECKHCLLGLVSHQSLGAHTYRHIHGYVCTLPHTYTLHTQTHTLHKHTHACTHMGISVHAKTHTHTHKHSHRHTNTNPRVYTQAFLYMQTRPPTHQPSSFTSRPQHPIFA